MSEHVSISPGEAADRLAIRESIEAYAFLNRCFGRRNCLTSRSTVFAIPPTLCLSRREKIRSRSRAVWGIQTFAALELNGRTIVVNAARRFALLRKQKRQSSLQSKAFPMVEMGGLDPPTPYMRSKRRPKRTVGDV